MIRLSRPHARAAGRLSKALFGVRTRFDQDMGRGHALLDAPLSDLPPTNVGAATANSPTSLPAGRAPVIRDRRFPLADASFADEILGRIREQREASAPLPTTSAEVVTAHRPSRDATT